MSKIINELGKIQQKDLDNISSDKAVQDIKGLLSYDAAVDREMLKTMKLDTHLKIADDKQTKFLEITALNNKYNGHVYHKDTIKQIAVNYRLRFLHTSRYKGAIDVQVPAKIKEFAKESNINLTQANLEYNFYMLAPAEDFDLKLVKKIKPHKDPALFYKLDDDHYKLIWKWGGDFNVLRLLQGWRWKNGVNFFLSSVLFALVVASFLAPIVTPLSEFTNNGYWLVWALTFLAFFAYFITCLCDKEGDFDYDKFSPNNWFSSTRNI